MEMSQVVSLDTFLKFSSVGVIANWSYLENYTTFKDNLLQISFFELVH